MNLEVLLSRVSDTDELRIEAGLLNKAGGIFRSRWPDGRALIVADSNTWSAAGERLSREMSNAGISLDSPLIFAVPPLLHADYRHVEAIRDQAAGSSDTILIAVGSGTINDLVKRASGELERPYLCFGTAASMDGYCSSGASLSKEGLKQTMACPAPKVVLADTNILKDAPPAASAAGYGDLASKLTAGSDWIIADFTGEDPIDGEVWEMVQPRLEGWLGSPEGLAAGDSAVLAGVFEGLNLSGLAMQVLGRSRAASGAEHLFSHIWEMSGHLGADGNPVSHGFQVSLGILTVTALTEEVFTLAPEDIDIPAVLKRYPSLVERERVIEKLMGRFPGWREYLAIGRQKHLSSEALEERLHRLKGGWEGLRSKVRERLPRYSEMRRMLLTAGCPVRGGDINLKRDTVLETAYSAQCMRNRYTILDLAYELGILEDVICRIKENPDYLR